MRSVGITSHQKDPVNCTSLRLHMTHAAVHASENQALHLVHITPEKFENSIYILKSHQMFSFHTTPEEFKNAAITGHFGLSLRKTQTEKSHD